MFKHVRFLLEKCWPPGKERPYISILEKNKIGYWGPKKKPHLPGVWRKYGKAGWKGMSWPPQKPCWEVASESRWPFCRVPVVPCWHCHQERAILRLFACRSSSRPSPALLGHRKADPSRLCFSGFPVCWCLAGLHRCEAAVGVQSREEGRGCRVPFPQYCVPLGSALPVAVWPQLSLQQAPWGFKTLLPGASDCSNTTASVCPSNQPVAMASCWC